jgi:hypothetical protein
MTTLDFCINSGFGNEKAIILVYSSRSCSDFCVNPGFGKEQSMVPA